MEKQAILELIAQKINALAIKEISLENKLHAYPPTSPGYHKTERTLFSINSKRTELQALLDEIFDEELK